MRALAHHLIWACAAVVVHGQLVGADPRYSPCTLELPLLPNSQRAERYRFVQGDGQIAGGLQSADDGGQAGPGGGAGPIQLPGMLQLPLLTAVAHWLGAAFLDEVDPRRGCTSACSR